MPGCGGPCVFFGQSTLLNTNVKKQSTESRSDYENVTDSANVNYYFFKSTESRNDYENASDSADVYKNR